MNFKFCLFRENHCSLNRFTCLVVFLILGCKTQKQLSYENKVENTPIEEGIVTVQELSTLGVWSSAKYIWKKDIQLNPVKGLIIKSKYHNNGRWVRVTEDFVDVTYCGVKADGLTLSDKALQDIFDGMAALGLKKIYFPKGKYVVGQIDIYPGFHIKGDQETWILKKENSTKFSRIFTFVKNLYSGEKDSETLTIENMNFDGRAHLQGTYEKYELEHQAMIFLHGDPSKKGRLKAEIKNCTFKNGVGDAIGLYVNVDAKIENIFVENVFRGGITATGGHSIITAKNVITKGDKHKTGIDIEIDGAGYANSYQLDFEGENFNLDGDFDVGVKSGNLTFKNIISNDTPFNIYSPDAKILIEDSKFHFKSSVSGEIYFPKNVTFRRTQFIFDVDPKDPTFEKPINILWNTSYQESKNLALTFDDCDFISKGKQIVGIYNSADLASNNNLLNVVNSRFKGNFSVNIDYHFGGTINVDNTYFEGDAGVLLKSLKSDRVYNYKATFNNIKFDKKMSYVVEYQENEANTLIIKDKSIKARSKGREMNGLTKVKTQ